MNNLQVFDYEGSEVRTLEIEGDNWFVATDVCRILEISNPTMALGRLDDDEKMTLNSTESHPGKRVSLVLA